MDALPGSPFLKACKIAIDFVLIATLHHPPIIYLSYLYCKPIDTLDTGAYFVIL